MPRRKPVYDLGARFNICENTSPGCGWWVFDCLNRLYVLKDLAQSDTVCLGTLRCGYYRTEHEAKETAREFLMKERMARNAASQISRPAF